MFSSLGWDSCPVLYYQYLPCRGLFLGFQAGGGAFAPLYIINIFRVEGFFRFSSWWGGQLSPRSRHIMNVSITEVFNYYFFKWIFLAGGGFSRMGVGGRTFLKIILNKSNLFWDSRTYIIRNINSLCATLYIKALADSGALMFFASY